MERVTGVRTELRRRDYDKVVTSVFWVATARTRSRSPSWQTHEVHGRGTDFGEPSEGDDGVVARNELQVRLRCLGLRLPRRCQTRVKYRVRVASRTRPSQFDRYYHQVATADIAESSDHFLLSYSWSSSI